MQIFCFRKEIDYDKFMVKQPSCTCPNATLLFSLLGKKWVLFILHVIHAGAHTFTDIRLSIGEANTKILTDRLKELVEHGILSHEGSSYHLTSRGKSLEKKLLELAEWWGESKKQ